MPVFGFSAVNTRYSESKEKALEWLRNQKAPNKTIPDPQLERRNFMLSYQIPGNSPVYKYLFGRSIIYDDALSVIAFTMNKEYKTASLILNAMRRNIRSDGGFWFDYNVNNSWPSEDDYSEAVERTGAIAWLGYSAVFYLQRRQIDEPEFLNSSKDAKTISNMAVLIGNYILTLQIHDKKDLRYGLVTGGKNNNVSGLPLSRRKKR